ncbi:MAG: macrolide ABC transporter ATP-binding protein [Candidatus Riflebacteria bacterium RBG_13_59_9]|nr:MAG: macrolide ABC transporter ATP-binding protein [Candidatus Riflebacteria bacterium RBG_13_59_9]
MPLIELRDVTKAYDMGKHLVNALRGVSFDVEASEYIAIMGPSGSGKSTVMNIMGCLDRPTEGVYLLDGQDVTKLSDVELAHIRNQRIGFVFQTFNLLPRTTALENVELPLIYSPRAWHRRERARKALIAVGLGDRLTHKSNELSGGEQQKVAIARAIVNEPSIILADEPTGNLDSKSGIEIMKVFQRLNDSGITLVVVTHEQFIADHARRIIRFHDGRVVKDALMSGRTTYSQEELRTLEAEYAAHSNSSRA